MFCFADNAAPESDVVVTGMGMVTALGLDALETWSQVVEGAQSARHLADHEVANREALARLLGRPPSGCRIDRGALSDRLAGNAGGFRHVPEGAEGDPANDILSASLAEALTQTGLSQTQVRRAGCVIGTSKSSLAAMDAIHQRFDSTVFQDQFLPDAPLRMIQQITGATGPGLCPVAACATGLVSIIQAAQLIRSGVIEVCFAGSSDSSLHPAVMASFHRLGVLSRSPEAATACRPFDLERDGFTIGEGAAVFVLESRRHAERRNALTLARIVSAGWQTDPTGLTQIDQSGAIVRATVQGALNGAQSTGLGYPDVVSVHGTATESNDLAEARGLAASLPSGTPCFGTKGATGHLLGAAGSVEFGLTLLAMQHDVVPPTVNHFRIDPQCPIYVSSVPESRPVESALKLSLGFGGQVAAVLIDQT